MTDLEHEIVTKWIKEEFIARAQNKYPTHKEILRKMLEVAKEVTYKDALEYGFGSAFRSRLSELRNQMNIVSRDKVVPTRYGTLSTVKAHSLEGE